MVGTLLARMNGRLTEDAHSSGLQPPALCTDPVMRALFGMLTYWKCPCALLAYVCVPVGNIDMTMINKTRCHVEYDGTHLETDL